ncbi:hypothetical protein P885DRAFT_10333, partial [Corynascus similis CBS 632.67]
QHAWIGTCCIDKASNAQMSETINPMLLWYRTAAVYPGYLLDFTSCPTIRDRFGAYQWSVRDGTLQELVVPCEVIFYDRRWVQSGQRKVL